MMLVGQGAEVTRFARCRAGGSLIRVGQGIRVMLLSVVLAGTVAAAQHARLFPPESLGLLEGPDRDAYQRPDQIMDALQIGEGSKVADLGAGGGWFTVAAGAPRRTERQGLRRRRPVADDRRDPAPGRSRRIAERRNGARHPGRRAVAGGVARRDPGRGRVSGGQAARDAAEEPRAVTQAERPHRDPQLQEGWRRPGAGIEVRVDAEKVLADAKAAGLELRKREAFLRYRSCSSSAFRRNESLPEFFAGYQQLVHAEIERGLGDGDSPVDRAMAYTALAPSKQVRAVVVLLCAELCRGNAARAVPAAAAIEFVHAASLILDDLPSMDDAPLRRGRRANHLEFGEPIAILAAFGL